MIIGLNVITQFHFDLIVQLANDQDLLNIAK